MPTISYGFLSKEDLIKIIHDQQEEIEKLKEDRRRRTDEIIRVFAGSPAEGEQYKSVPDYIELAAKNGFVYKEDSCPPRTSIKARWYCAKCQKVWRVSYSRMELDPPVCQCKPSAKGRTEIEYALVAARANVTFVGPKPSSVNAPTLWRTKSGVVISASFYQMGGGKSGKPLRRIQQII